jgi:thiol reductant ABC exporter CydC subunit
LTSALRRLLAFADAPRPRLALAVLLGTATIVFGAGLMATAGYLISRAAEQPPILSLTVAIVAVRFFGIARPVARYLERLVSHDLAFRVLARARVRAYERMEPLAPAGLGGYRHGDLLSRLVADVDALQNLHLRGLLPPLVAAASGAVCVGVTAAFLPAAALALAGGLLAVALVVPLVSGWLTRRTAGRQAPARGVLTSELVELLQAAPELVVYGREEERLARVQAADRDLVRIARRDAFAAGLGDGLQLGLAGATVVGVLWLAVEAHADGRLDRVLIALLALLALASFEAVQPLAGAARELGATLAAGQRVLELVERRSRIVDPDDPSPAPTDPSLVSLEDVRARYGTGEPWVLDGASLCLERGSRVALVGESGAGKTTVTNLLLRFLDPERGRIAIDGRDIRQLRQEDVRSLIAVAGQDAHLFSASIRDNVGLGRPEATGEELERVLRLVGAWDWVRRLPDGWDTPVGEQGRELSGGERQRLCAARALLVRPALLVLDEPTAHLDAQAASALIRDVFAAAGDASVLLITHRPEGLELCDRVVELRHGEIASAE